MKIAIVAIAIVLVAASAAAAPVKDYQGVAGIFVNNESSETVTALYVADGLVEELFIGGFTGATVPTDEWPVIAFEIDRKEGLVTLLQTGNGYVVNGSIQDSLVMVSEMQNQIRVSVSIPGDR